MSDVRFALVTQVSPSVQIRFAGDTADVTVVKGNSSLTLATSDTVKVSKVGSQWCVDYVIGDL